jgi:hypothetical protein
MVTPDTLMEFIECVPSGILQTFKNMAAIAPTTDEGWDKMIFFCIECVVNRDPERHAQREKERMSRHRRGIETIRNYFGNGHEHSSPQNDRVRPVGREVQGLQPQRP